MTIDENNKVDDDKVPEGKEPSSTEADILRDQTKDVNVKTSAEIAEPTGPASSVTNNNNSDDADNRKQEPTTELDEIATKQEVAEEPEKKSANSTKSKRKSSSSPKKKAKSSSSTIPNDSSPDEKDGPVQKAISTDANGEENANEVNSPSTQPTEDEKPLFEQPILLEGKRRRTATARLEINELTPKKEVQLPKGNGKPLGEIEYINYQITNTNGEQLVPLQYICFGRKVAHANMKKTLRTFNGFDFKKGTSEYERTISRLLKYKKSQLKVFLDVLGLHQNGRNEEQAERILDFLIEPYDEGKKLPKKVSKQNSASKKRQSTDSSSKASGIKRNNKTTSETIDESNMDSNDKDDPIEDDDDEEREEEEVDEYEPGKGKKKSSPKKKVRSLNNKNSASKDKGQKRKRVSATTKEDSKKIRNDTTVNDENDDEKETTNASGDTNETSPISEDNVANNIKHKNETKEPSEDSLRSTVKRILNGVDLSGVTMKNVLKDVYSKYPDFDLTDRKDFIKDIVKEMISST